MNHARIINSLIQCINNQRHGNLSQQQEQVQAATKPVDLNWREQGLP